jgi:hypothetical protein
MLSVSHLVSGLREEERLDMNLVNKVIDLVGLISPVQI